MYLFMFLLILFLSEMEIHEIRTTTVVKALATEAHPALNVSPRDNTQCFY